MIYWFFHRFISVPLLPHCFLICSIYSGKLFILFFSSWPWHEISIYLFTDSLPIVCYRRLFWYCWITDLFHSIIFTIYFIVYLPSYYSGLWKIGIGIFGSRCNQQTWLHLHDDQPGLEHPFMVVLCPREQHRGSKQGILQTPWLKRAISVVSHL